MSQRITFNVLAALRMWTDIGSNNFNMLSILLIHHPFLTRTISGAQLGSFSPDELVFQRIVFEQLIHLLQRKAYGMLV